MIPSPARYPGSRPALCHGAVRGPSAPDRQGGPRTARADHAADRTGNGADQADRSAGGPER